MSYRNTWILLTSLTLLITGCAENAPLIKKEQPTVTKETNATKVKPQNVPQKAPRKVELKEVEDDNYSSEYMYPEDKVKKKEVTKVASNTPTIATTMNKTECVGMIGQEKFDKYTQMFGNEASSIKRCAMLKAMN